MSKKKKKAVPDSPAPPPEEIIEEVITTEKPNKVIRDVLSRPLTKVIKRATPSEIDISAYMRDKMGSDDLGQWVQDAQNIGEPIFTINDLRTTYHPLAQLMRLLMIEDNITKNKFDSLHRQKSQESFMATNAISYSKNNMYRTVTQPDLTWNFCEKLLVTLGYNIVDVAIKLQKIDTKEVKELKKSDVVKLISDHPYHPSVQITHTDHVEE